MSLGSGHWIQFDSDNSGGLDRRELEALAKQLAPGVSKMDVKYLVAMLDADGDGQVTYQELMDSVVEIVHAGWWRPAPDQPHTPAAFSLEPPYRRFAAVRAGKNAPRGWPR